MKDTLSQIYFKRISTRCSVRSLVSSNWNSNSSEDQGIEGKRALHGSAKSLGAHSSSSIFFSSVLTSLNVSLRRTLKCCPSCANMYIPSVSKRRSCAFLSETLFSATRIMPGKLQVAKAPYAHSADEECIIKTGKGEEAISLAAEATDA